MQRQSFIASEGGEAEANIVSWREEIVRAFYWFSIETFKEWHGRRRLWLEGHSRGNNEFGVPSLVACAGEARVHSPRCHDEFLPALMVTGCASKGDI